MPGEANVDTEIIPTLRQAVLVEPVTNHPEILDDSGVPVLVPEITNRQILKLSLPHAVQEYFIRIEGIPAKIAQTQLDRMEEPRTRKKIVEPAIMLRRINPDRLKQLQSQGYRVIPSDNLYHSREVISKQIA